MMNVTGEGRSNSGLRTKAAQDLDRRDNMSEGYRRCCTSVGWSPACAPPHEGENIGIIPRFRLHRPLDVEDEKEALKTIKADTGRDFTAIGPARPKREPSSTSSGPSIAPPRACADRWMEAAAR